MSELENKLFYPYGVNGEIKLSNYKILKDKKGNLSALYLTVKSDVSHMRGHYVTDQEILISYNKNQQVEGIYMTTIDEEIASWGETILHTFSPQTPNRKFDVVETIFMESLNSDEQENTEFDTIEKTTYAIDSNN